MIDALGVSDALQRIGRTAPQPITALSPTVAATLERYAASRPSLDTANKYRIIAKHTINPVLGCVSVAELTVDDVQSWLNGLTIAGRSIVQAHMLLKAALTAAIDRGELSINPARKASRSGGSGVRIPRRPPGKQAVFLSRHEAVLVVAAVPDRQRVLIEFLLATGCRIGEALALTPADIGTGTATFNKSYSRRANAAGNRPFDLGAAKTAASERTIAVPQGVLDKLNMSGALVFTNDTGYAINADSFRKNVWIPAMAKSGLPKHRRPGLHDLRHTHASRLIDAGISIVAVSKRLGHSNVSITLSTYAHVASDADERILAALA
ncbi:Site-specific recombinase XerD [Mycobacterium rhizamassiliense]|uniref:Site-specific recombinase XerD n=1 Tax=Mycobacterium rhizamassiliense TaxID=1841860 RepID=A0A2U3NNL5_9MYCO|nr:site-specific integrase [Mycobacterium rhizamassiliense]SPM33092.1 Site-specific recombinase XerD [Mycobacterium rhizamassiliense]